MRSSSPVPDLQKPGRRIGRRGPARGEFSVNLKALGYEVDIAATGEEALSRASQRRPDAVILDLGLPRIDGIQVIEGLRGWSTVPILVLTVREREAASR